MTGYALPIDASSGSPSYTAQQTRMAFSALMGPAPAGRPLGATSGVRQGTPSTTVTCTGTGSMTWNCAAFSAVLDVEASATAGPYLAAFDGTDTGTITAQDPTNPRIDIIYAQINDTVQDGSGLRGCSINYLAGTAAPSPVAPSPPNTRTLVIANISVPKSGTGAPSATWVAPIAGGPQSTATTWVQGGLRFQVWTQNVANVPSSTSTHFTIPFPTAFSAAAIYVSPTVADIHYVPSATTYTSTNFSLGILNPTTGAPGGTTPVNFFAIGPA